MLPIGAALTRFYVNLDVADRPGVLAAIAHTFADKNQQRQHQRDHQKTRQTQPRCIEIAFALQQQFRGTRHANALRQQQG